ncbi:hypothetical protein J7T55_008505 [Diaporthe amygdali]|uniref:uncharacterized protein n=1 Tax=Phomopsis amygdali TaxID=1214568 RepID=UPI0022FE4C13|nr:uncharacterized protein J7T55_008505 [Diaporthe amygdali]KAJ0121341.1 hypothetical protein J7T55_008505 [Diaporthe amygdali]
MDASTFPIMLNLTSQIPLPLPPDHKLFFKHGPSHAPAAIPGLAHNLTNPSLLKTFAREMNGPTLKKEPSLLEKHFQEQQQQRLNLKKKNEEQAEKEQQQKESQPEPQQQTQPQHPPSSQQSARSSSTPSASESSADTKVPPPSASPNTPNQPVFDLAGDHPAFADPKYVQMVSRMAAFYQQRCQAILNYQQQRCQTWATGHRQKCQEMMQSAMLVVAWYIRDRIGRRRRKSKRAFRRGLREKNTAAAMRRLPKGEIVRKWVMNIPDAALSPNNGMRDDANLDMEEREFDIEKEVTPDKDSQLFSVADQMIKSQLAKIDIPLLGALNLDDSDSESDDDDDVGRFCYAPEDYEMEDDGEDDGEYDDDDIDYEDETQDPSEDEISQEALNGTGKGSLKRKRSDSDSDMEQLEVTVPEPKRRLAI